MGANGPGPLSPSPRHLMPPPGRRAGANPAAQTPSWPPSDAGPRQYATLHFTTTLAVGLFPAHAFLFPHDGRRCGGALDPVSPQQGGVGVHTRDGARPLPWGPGGQHRLACSRLPDRRLRSQRGGSEDITFCTDSVALDGTCSTQYSTIYSHTHTHTFALFWCMPARRPAPAPVLWCLAQCKQHHSTGTTK